MADDATAGLPIASAVVGRMDLGPATLLVDDDRLTIVLSSAEAWDAPIRVRLDSVAVVTRERGSVALTTRDGTRIVLATTDADSAATMIMNACRVLPEFTRALRAMGSRRTGHRDRESAIEDEARYFGPLLAARRLAAEARTPDAAIAAFGSAELIAALDALVDAYAAARAGESVARRRAIEAEISEIVEPLRGVLAELGPVAAAASVDVEDLALWRAWTAQLHVVFEVADRVWVALDPVLVSDPVIPRTGKQP